MADRNKPEVALEIEDLMRFYNSPRIEDLIRLIAVICSRGQQSEEEVLEKLLEIMGYKPNLNRPQLRVKLNDNLKTFLKQKEEEIIDKLKCKKVPISMDRTTARYIIRTALCNHCCDETEKKLKKNDVDKFLGYCGRTMRIQQNNSEDKILNPDSESKERKIYLELCSDLEQFAI